MKTKNELPVVLVLSASDPDGEQGIQADLSTLSCLGRRVFVSTIITGRLIRQAGAVVVHPVSSDILRSQLAEALDALQPDVVKIGFLPNAVCVCEAVALLRRFSVRKIVYSPSFTEYGDRLSLSVETLRAIVCHLLPVVRLLIVRRTDSLRLLRACPGALSSVNVLDDVNLVRCLISTFHCACYLVRTLENNILALRNELFYYRSFREDYVSGESVFSSTSKEYEPVQRKNSSTFPIPAAVSCDLLQSFAVAAAGAWAFTDDVKKTLYDARICVESWQTRHRYLNSDFREAPYYPLTDGGNYE